MRLLLIGVLQMYKIIPLTLKNRVEIPVGAVVELEVNEKLTIPYSVIGKEDMAHFVNYATFHIRKSIAKKGVLQCVTTPFPEGYSSYPTVVVHNKHVAPVELLQGEEIGSVWVFTG